MVALTQTADGSVWAGAMPGNRLWKIDVARRQGDRPAPQLKDVETIWSLAASGQHGLRGHRPVRQSCSRSAAARAKVIFDTDDKRITALATTSDGAVWAGTSDRALVFRYDPKDGKTRAMADFAGNEVSAIVRRTATASWSRPTTSPIRPRPLLARPRPQVEGRRQADRGQGPGRPRRPTSAPSPAPTRIRSPVTDLGRKGAKKGKGALFKHRQPTRRLRAAARADRRRTSRRCSR